MDRNSIIGIVLIGVILVGYSLITKPAREAQMEAIRKSDSIAMVEELKRQELAQDQIQDTGQTPEQAESNDIPANVDSDLYRQQERNYGVFMDALQGEEEYYTLENKLIKPELATRGGRPYSATLKKYQTHDSLPVVLFDGDSSQFDLQFFADNRRINTSELYFNPGTSRKTLNASESSKSITMRLDIADGAFIEY